MARTNAPNQRARVNIARRLKSIIKHLDPPTLPPSATLKLRAQAANHTRDTATQKTNRSITNAILSIRSLHIGVK
jgi:hypothetical protein